MAEVTTPVVKEEEIQTEEPSQPQNEADHEEKDEDEFKGTLDLLGPAYARNAQFFRVLIFSSAFQGILLGAVALAFFNLYTALAQATWLRGEYEEALNFMTSDNGGDPGVLDVLKLGNGEWWYVGMTTGAGLAVGALKVIWSALVPDHTFPEKVPGFLKEIERLKSHDLWLPLPVLATSAISIGLGGSVGPEAALGITGSASGTFLARRWKIGPFQAKKFGDEEGQGGFLSNVLPDFSQEIDLCTVDGMAAAYGAIFPSQFLSPLLIHELRGSKNKCAFAQTVARTGLAATFAYVFFAGLKDRTILGQVILPETGYEELSVFQPLDLLFGALLGIISGIVGFLGFLSLAVNGIVGNKISTKLNDLGDDMGLGSNVLGKLLTPVIGGILVGLICVAAPLTLSDGSAQLKTVMFNGETLGLDTVIVSGILKIVAGGISLGFGFVGGPTFPLIFAGTCLGVASILIAPGLNPIVAIPTCLVAVPCAFIPALLFFTLLSSMMFVLGGAATSPVFIGCITSYSTVCGLGIVQDLMMRATRNKETNANTSDTQGTVYNPLLQDANPPKAEDISPAPEAEYVSPSRLASESD
jgi:H+/Cl- antiporter ClcA